MSIKKQLNKYHKKRDFTLTAEPFGGDKETPDAEKTIFVIQKHDATNLHFDFRLLVNGVLKSWAVPKGPSTNPDEKRLAVPTEDHPLEYATFEGTIPKEQYGGGTVIVWDAGTYENLKKDDKGNPIPMGEQLENGSCTFVLNGKKLQGGYTLFRFKKGKKPLWMLRKVDDEQADARRNPVNTENKSVLTGRTMKEIASESSK